MKLCVSPLVDDMSQACTSLLATRVPGCLASFSQREIDKRIPLRPDAARRGRKPKSIQTLWGEWQELCSFLMLLGVSVKGQGSEKWRECSMKTEFKPYPCPCEVASPGYWEGERVGTGVRVWSTCSCMSSCVCLCHEENDRRVLEQVIIDSYSQFVLGLYPCWLILLKQCELRIFLSFTCMSVLPASVCVHHVCVVPVKVRRGRMVPWNCSSRLL